MKKETEKEKNLRLNKLKSISFNPLYKQDAKYCIDNGLTIYPAVQQNGRIFLFVQLGEKFKRLNDKVYDQDSELAILEYTTDIYLAYKEYAKNSRDKRNGK